MFFNQDLPKIKIALQSRTDTAVFAFTVGNESVSKCDACLLEDILCHYKYSESQEWFDVQLS